MRWRLRFATRFGTICRNKLEVPTPPSPVGPRWILFEAMKRSKTLSGKYIAAELAKTTDFDGVTGKISIDADRNAVKPAVLLEMKDGVPSYVSTIEPGL